MTHYNIRDLFVEVTNFCLQGCVHCSSCSGSEHYEEIPFEKLCSLVDELLPQGLQSFTLSGGEPFLYPQFMPLIEFLRNKSLAVSVYTCGIVKDSSGCLSAISEEMFAALRLAGVEKIVFSLHAAEDLTQEKISGVSGGLDITRRSIANAMKQNMNVELHCVPMRCNYKEIPSVINLAFQMGIRSVSLLRLVAQGRCSPSLLLDEKEKREVLHMVDAAREKYPGMYIRLGAPFNCLTLSARECTAAKDKLLISANGDIFPCEAFKYQRGTRPTIYEDRGIVEVWKNDPLLQAIRALSQEKISYCNTCELFPQCHGGCAGQRMHVHGTLYQGPEPDCKRKNHVIME